MNHPIIVVRTIVLATHNPGKVAELNAMLKDLPFSVISAPSIMDAPPVEEDADTLRGNAEKKARALFLHTGAPSLADDTGLEVDSLNGAPGVHSARYAGPASDDAANRERLLAEMRGSKNRAARFRTVLAFVDRTGIHFFDGLCEGKITHEEHGTGGFGYDRIFQPLDAVGRTFAEMNEADKNRISHRGRAFGQFAEFLKTSSEAP